MKTASSGVRGVSRARHEMVDHVSELTLRIRAPSFPELLSEATRAFGELVPPTMRGRRLRERRDFEVGGIDRASLLVQWLNEMVYLCEVEQWLPAVVEEVRERGETVWLRASGVSLTRPFVLVKAATLHGARVSEDSEGLTAEVTLDI